MARLVAWFAFLTELLAKVCVLEPASHHGAHDVGIRSLSVVMQGAGCMWLRTKIGLDMQVGK